MRRITAILLALICALTLLSCAGDGGHSPDGSQPEVREDNPWKDIMDVSSRKTVQLLVFGNRPADFDEVCSRINERMVRLINTEISVKFISLSEWTVLYPLMLTGGENIDLIYAAYWTHYSQEALRGAFYELSEDFIARYMPLSWTYTPDYVWQEAEVNGKHYALPRTYTDNSSYGAVLIREDILSKTGMQAVSSYDEYERFLLKAAALEEDGYAMHAFPSLPMVSQLMLPKEHMISVGNELVWDSDDGTIDSDRIQFLYDTDEYLDYCLRMAEWAKAGVWPSNAISGTIHTFVQFEEGRSYSVIVRMHEAQNYLDSVQAKGYKAHCFCLLDDGAYVRKSEYSGDMLAISSHSADPERAALCLDVLKNDREINLLCQGGIEGRHYLLNEDGTRSRGPEYTDYVWSDWAWALRNERFYPLENQSDEVKQVAEELDEHLISPDKWPFQGFHTDDRKFETEITLIRSLIQEYEYSFNLGVYGDETAEKVAEFRGKLYEAGLREVMNEWRSQLKAFLDE